MKVAIVGVTGSIGAIILQHTLQRSDVTDVLAITRKPLKSTEQSDNRIRNVIIPDFGALDTVPDTTWTLIEDADAIVWAMGTYDLNKDVNYAYPLEFQKLLARRLADSCAQGGRQAKLRFILLGGAFTETDQSRSLYFLPEQRRMKGLLQAEAIKFAEEHSDYIAVHVIRPGGILIGWNACVNWIAESVMGANLAVRGEELGAFTADLAVNGSERKVIENWEIVETGRHLLAIALPGCDR